MIGNISIIIQARTGSTRLPNKITKTFFDNSTLLDIIISRLKEVKTPIIVATTDKKTDDQVEKIALDNEVNIFRGSENNVLSRFIKTAEKYNIDKIIRICADNPLLDVDSLLKLKEEFIISNVDYWCYSTKDKTPTIRTHYGFWGEGVTLSALKKIQSMTNDSLYAEHVTNYIYTYPKTFKIHYEQINSKVEQSLLRLTIDTIKDFELVKEIYSELISRNIKITALNVSKFVSENDEWLKVMQNEINLNRK